MFCDAGKALASGRSLAARFAALRASQGALLAAHVTQALAQRLEVIKPGVVNFRMVTAQDDLVLVVVEDAALEFAWDRHGSLPVENANGHYRNIRPATTEAGSFEAGLVLSPQRGQAGRNLAAQQQRLCA